MKKFFSIVLVLFFMFGCANIPVNSSMIGSSNAPKSVVPDCKNAMNESFKAGLVVGWLSGMRLEAMNLKNEEEVERVDALALVYGFTFNLELGLYIPFELDNQS